MNIKLYDRQIRLFGSGGQKRIKNTKVAIVGLGGLGSHLVQQLSYLGIVNLTLVDPEALETTNKNRLVGSSHIDPEGIKKVNIAERLAKSINPNVNVIKICENLKSDNAFNALKAADLIFGSVDNDGARLLLNHLCTAYEIPYIDLATDIVNEGNKITTFGGHVVFIFDKNGCLYCLGQISTSQAARELMSSDVIRDREGIYGVPREELDFIGPSVISLNGIIASIAVTEFIMFVTGIRRPNRFLKYQGQHGVVLKNEDAPSKDCYYCKYIRGKKDDADTDKLL